MLTTTGELTYFTLPNFLNSNTDGSLSAKNAYITHVSQLHYKITVFDFERYVLCHAASLAIYVLLGMATNLRLHTWYYLPPHAVDYYIITEGWRWSLVLY